jgi:uncharacterized protein YqeY
MSAIRDSLESAIKDAMRARDKDRLGVLRMASSALKQIEIDERTELDEDRVLAVLDKLVKQRNESIQQYREGGRDDLADKEEAEVAILREFLPQPLSDDEIATLIDEAIAETGASSMQEMGKVMGVLKPKMQGRADMSAVSAKVKERLG